MDENQDVEMTNNNDTNTQQDNEAYARKDYLENTDPEQLQNQTEEKARGYLMKQRFKVIIPSYAAWFDRENINDVEKNSLPEFFNGRNRNKNETVYKEFRDFMIDSYRLNPLEYLTVTACRRNLAGDVASVMRVHAFLEQWGLINYQIDPESRPSLLMPQFTGHFQVVLDTPKGLQPHVPAKDSKINNEDGGKEYEHSEKKLKVGNEILKKQVNMELRKNIYDNAADAAALMDDNQRKLNSSLTSRKYNCYTSGEDVTKVRYHNLHSKQNISELCFKHGLFPGNFQNVDYVKIEQAAAANTMWNDQEVLLLLEAIEMYQDDWDAVQYHVNTRSKEQCIAKFLQMPIEDAYLAKNSENGVEKNKKGSKEYDESKIAKSLNQLKESLDESKTQQLKERAKALLSNEEATQTKLVKSLVEAELRKFEMKMAKIGEMEKLLNTEKQQIEKEQTRLYLDRLSLKSQAERVLTKLKDAASEEDQEQAKTIAQEAVELASQNPKVSLNEGDAEVKQGVKVPKPTLKPISLDIPQTYKFWSA